MKSLYSIVGMKYRDAEALVASLPVGEPLHLIREPTNKHDPGAVQVWARGRHVAYLKATQARPLAMAMDEQIKKVKITPLSFMRPAKLVRSPNSNYPMAEVEE